MKRPRLTAAATCMVMLLACVTRADVLEQLPADAFMVVKVNNLKATSDKFAKLAQDLGLAAMAGPPMADPLGFLQQQAKMTNGINTTGDLGFAYLNPDTSGSNDPEQSVLFLIPVTDYQAFLGNWPDAVTDGAVSEVKLGDSDDPGFVAQWGTYAALSPSKELVANKPASVGIKVPPATTRELASKDMILLGNFNALRDKVLPKLKEGREKIAAEMEQHMADDPNAAKFAPLAKSVANRLVDVAEGFMRDTEVGTVGVSIGADGIGITLMADFVPDSYIGKCMSSAKNNAQNVLVGLPGGKYLVFGGSVNDPQLATKMLDDLALPVVKDAVAIGPEFQAVQDYYDGLKQYIAGSTGGTFGMFAPSGTLGADPIVQVVSIQRGDAPKMMEGYKKMMSSQAELMKALGFPEDQVKTSFTPNAKTVAGNSFDLMQSNVNVGDPNDPGTQMAREFMKMLYGGDGVSVYMGNVDGTLFTFMGASDDAVTASINSLKDKSAPLADLPGVRSVTANLPQQNLGIIYFQVDEMVNAGLSYAKNFGFNMPIQLPPDLPPVGATVATEGPAFRMDTYVPTQLVQSLVAAGMQAYMQMQGGPGRGGGL